MKSEQNHKMLITALNTVGAILIAIAVIAVVMHFTGIMAQASFIHNLWWAKGSAIAGLALWEAGTIVRKMDQLTLSRRNGFIGIALLSLAILTAAAFYFTSIGNWVFYLSFALFIAGTAIGETGKDEPSVS